MTASANEYATFNREVDRMTKVLDVIPKSSGEEYTSYQLAEIANVSPVTARRVLNACLRLQKITDTFKFPHYDKGRIKVKRRRVFKERE